MGNEVKIHITAEGAEQVSASADGVAGKFKSLGSELAKGLTFGVGFEAARQGFDTLKDGISDLISTAAEHQKVMAQTETVIKSTGDASGMSAEQMEQFAQAQSKVTTFSADTVQSTENLLSTFTNLSGSVFPQATKTVLDVATAMHEDTSSAAVQLGKALNDPEKGMSALQRIGVTFTQSQKDAVKAMQDSGNMAGAQAIVLGELQKEFGGSAEAAGKTFAGQLSILGNQLDIVKEKLGTELLAGLAAVGGVAIPLILKGFDLLSDGIGKAEEAIDGIVAAFKSGGLSAALSQIGQDSSKLGTFLLNGLGDLAGTLLHAFQSIPWGNIGAGLLSGMETIGRFLADHWRDVLVLAVYGIPGLLVDLIGNAIGWNRIGDAILSAVRSAVSLAERLGTWLRDEVGGINWGAVWDTLKGKASNVADQIIANLKAAGSLAEKIGGWLATEVSSIDWSAVWGAIKSGAVDVGGLLLSGLQAAGSLAERIGGWIGTEVGSIDWAGVWSHIQAGGSAIVQGLERGASLAADLGTWLGGEIAKIDWSGIWSRVKGAGTAIVAGLKTGANLAADLGEWIGSEVAKIDWTAVWSKAKGAADGLKTALSSVNAGAALSDTTQQVNNLGDAISTKLGGDKPGIVKSLFDSLGQNVSGALSSVVDLVRQLGQHFQEVLNSKEVKDLLDNLSQSFTAMQQTGAPLADILKTLASVVGGVLLTALDGLAATFRTMEPLITTLLVPAFTILKGAIDALGITVRTIAEVVRDTVQLVDDLIHGKWSQSWNDAKKVVADLVTGVFDLVTSMGEHVLTAVVQLVTGVGGQFLQLSGNVLGTLAGLAKDGLSTVAGWVGDMLGKLADFVLQAPQKFADFATQGLQKLAQFSLDAVESMGTFVTEAVKKIGELPGDAVSALGDLSTKFYNAAADAVAGFAKGILDHIEDGVNAVKNFGGSVIGAITSFGHSPWPTWIQAGADAGQGWIVGVQSKIDAARTAALQYGHAAIDGITQGVATAAPELQRALDGVGEMVKSSPVLALTGALNGYALKPPTASGTGTASGSGPTGGLGGTLSAQQIAAGLAAAGMPASAIPTMTAILLAESGGSTTAGSPAGAYGLGQFMPGTWAGLGMPGTAATADLQTTFAAIAKLQGQQGFTPWDAYSYVAGNGPYGEQYVGPGQGSYQQFLGQTGGMTGGGGSAGSASTAGWRPAGLAAQPAIDWSTAQSVIDASLNPKAPATLLHNTAVAVASAIAAGDLGAATQLLSTQFGSDLDAVLNEAKQIIDTNARVTGEDAATLDSLLAQAGVSAAPSAATHVRPTIDWSARESDLTDVLNPKAPATLLHHQAQALSSAIFAGDTKAAVRILSGLSPTDLVTVINDAKALIDTAAANSGADAVQLETALMNAATDAAPTARTNVIPPIDWTARQRQIDDVLQPKAPATIEDHTAQAVAAAVQRGDIAGATALLAALPQADFDPVLNQARTVIDAAAAAAGTSATGLETNLLTAAQSAAGTAAANIPTQAPNWSILNAQIDAILSPKAAASIEFRAAQAIAAAIEGGDTDKATALLAQIPSTSYDAVVRDAQSLIDDHAKQAGIDAGALEQHLAGAALAAAQGVAAQATWLTPETDPSKNPLAGPPHQMGGSGYSPFDPYGGAATGRGGGGGSGYSPFSPYGGAAGTSSGTPVGGQLATTHLATIASTLGRMLGLMQQPTQSTEAAGRLRTVAPGALA